VQGRAIEINEKEPGQNPMIDSIIQKDPLLAVFSNVHSSCLPFSCRQEVLHRSYGADGPRNQCVVAALLFTFEDMEQLSVVSASHCEVVSWVLSLGAS